MRRISILLAFAVLAAAAQADPVYRSKMPDGRVVYGDKPAPGALESREVDQSKQNIVSPQRPAPAPAGSAAATPQKKGTAIPGSEERVTRAEKALAAAKAALEAGREVKEGDRIGVAKQGASRFSDSYEQRVKRLEDAVAAAQKELEDARAAY
jgi:hypothetical protein